MESRLPKPKLLLKKSVSTMNINSKVNSAKTMEEQNPISQATGSSNVNVTNNTKDMSHRTGKVMNENKGPPSKMVRAKTMSTISTRATKRTGPPVTNESERKRPTIHPPKATEANRTVRKALTVASNQVTENGLAKKTNKVNSWDYKGRFANAKVELNTVREKYKDITDKYTVLQNIVDDLKASESKCKAKAEELTASNSCMTVEIKSLRSEVTKLQESEKNLTVTVRESEISLREMSSRLKDFEEKCTSYESEVMSLKSNLKCEREANVKLTETNQELQCLVHDMDKQCRYLHNAIQELRGNIRVFCRVRPRTPKEAAKSPCTINFVDECTIEVGRSDGSDALSCSGKNRGSRQEFSFDKVFPPNASQADVFEELSMLVQSALEGYNVCIFAYGQTGSGKTYTMVGEPGLDTEGMIPRTVRHIFDEIRHFQLRGWEYRIEASFLEIYNEHIVDLLDSQPKTHEIKMADSKGHDLYVSNLRVERIRSSDELCQCLLTAQNNRAVAATHANERSSRSHSVARIRLIGTHTTNGEVSIGNLNLVDLAGSERLKTEEAARTTETKNINKSLANLGNVILALLKKQEHVPYRNSKLTHLLMPSLGGNSKTLMLLNISPLDECYNETLNSLRFASNVNNCKTGNIRRTRTVLSSITL